METLSRIEMITLSNINLAVSYMRWSWVWYGKGRNVSATLNSGNYVQCACIDISLSSNISMRRSPTELIVFPKHISYFMNVSPLRTSSFMINRPMKHQTFCMNHWRRRNIILSYHMITSGYRVSQKERTFRMLLKPQCAGSITICRHPLCLEFDFLVVSY